MFLHTRNLCMIKLSEYIVFYPVTRSSWCYCHHRICYRSNWSSGPHCIHWTCQPNKSNKENCKQKYQSRGNVQSYLASTTIPQGEQAGNNR